MTTPSARLDREVAHHNKLEPRQPSCALATPQMRSLPPLATNKSDSTFTLIPLDPLSEKRNVDSASASMCECTKCNNTTQRRYRIRTKLYRAYLRWFDAYRVLATLSFVANLTALCIVLTQHAGGAEPSYFLIGTSVNIFVTVLVRQEDLVNASFSLVSKLPKSLPLVLRESIADLHHYGGVHVGCAISALAWYLIFVIYNTISLISDSQSGKVTIWRWLDNFTCFLFICAILAVCALAHPYLRSNRHNLFEHTHRFGGWTALLVLWINTGVSTRATPNPSPLYTSPSLWFLAATTFLIMLPWCRMRRIPIISEPVSSREVRLIFPFVNMPYTCTARFSLNPLMEWHGFATVPTPDSRSAYILISKAGDWTSSIIKSPPKHIWIRNPPNRNFLCFAPLFNSLLLVATGAGIGPMLSLLSSPSTIAMRDAGVKIRVIWVVYATDAPYWTFVHEIIRRIDPEPKIFDSQCGRPDVAFEAAYLAEQEDVEAVMVVSNPKVTRAVLETCRRGGRKAYGATFDS